MFKKWSFFQKNEDEDFSKFFGNVQLMPKERLIEKCKANGVCIYVDDSSETSSGSYALFRGVASEAELERRLCAKTAASQATRANIIASLAFLVALAAFVKSFFLP